jgi:CDP-glucose 4,6-dehydratase
MGGMVDDHLAELKGKRVLVTGDTGFKGSWLSLWLHMLGAKVMGYALPPEYKQSHFAMLELDEIITHIDGDIRDIEELNKVFNDFKPEIVFHLAAQALVRRSYKEPKLTIDTNVGGSVNVLESIRRTPSVRSLIFVTSDKCYRNNEWIWGYRENDPLGGHDPYSASKAAAEIIFSSYVDSFFSEQRHLGISSVRAGNVIGGGDWSTDRIVPDSIKALEEGQPLVLRNPGAMRPWQHVLEPLYGYMMLSVKQYQEPQKYSGAWNFGPSIDSIRPVEDLAREVVSSWGAGSIKIESSSNDPYEAGLLNLNCDKANQVLGWRSRWDFETTVSKTVDWYKDVAGGISGERVSRQQIQEFMGGILK